GKLNEPVRAKAPAGRGERMDPSMDVGAASQRRIVSAPSISLDDDDDDDAFDTDMPPRPADILPDDDEDGWMMRAPARSGGKQEP
ncbi:hypothetical protein, partial [Burkholderia sp. SIMBA_052]|uniref:hypothetical protein n=1 Tax=Burkholderia sp. SIMBA_052 TaxID=3085793 RepID=UPI00397B5949